MNQGQIQNMHTKEAKNNKPKFEKEMNIKANVKYNFKLKLEKIV